MCHLEFPRIREWRHNIRENTSQVNPLTALLTFSRCCTIQVESLTGRIKFFALQLSEIQNIAIHFKVSCVLSFTSICKQCCLSPCCCLYFFSKSVSRVFCVMANCFRTVFNLAFLVVLQHSVNFKDLGVVNFQEIDHINLESLVSWISQIVNSLNRLYRFSLTDLGAKIYWSGVFQSVTQ